MKIYPQPIESPDGVSSWVHEDLLDSRYPSSETKVSMDAFDTLLRDLPTPSSTLAELKPLDPLDYLTNSPDTSVRHEQISSSSPSHIYKGAITNHNTFLGYSGTPEPVSTTTSPMASSTSLNHVKQEPPSIGIPQDIDDIATIIGSAISENTLNNSLMSEMVIPDNLDSLNPTDLDIEAWLESMGSVKPEPHGEPMDSLIHSSMSPSSLSPNVHGATQVPLPSTTSHLITTTINEYDPNSHLHHQQSHHSTPTSSPMLQSLLAAGTVTNNNNYLQGLVTETVYQKHDVSMPILQARLTQGLKDVGSGNISILKADPMFNRTYFSSKDSLPHSTDPTTYTVTTTDDFLKYDSRSYLDNSQLDSPESTDMSSTKLGLDFSDLKGKNRNRMSKSTKIPIRTEGTKDKPVHHCTVCNRGFLNKSNIKVHLRTHTGEKPFKCETCNKAFRQKAHLLKHYQIHRREREENTCNAMSNFCL